MTVCITVVERGGLHTAVLLAASLAALACSGSGGPAPQPPDLSGKWILKIEESDGPRPPGRGGGRAGFPGRPGDRRGPGPGGQSPLRTLMMASRAFEIVQTDSAITFSLVEGTTRTLRPDDASREERIQGLGRIEVRARWKRAALETEWTLADDIKVKETYELVSEGRQLRVKVRVEGYRLPRSLEMTRIYDALPNDGVG